MSSIICSHPFTFNCLFVFNLFLFFYHLHVLLLILKCVCFMFVWIRNFFHSKYSTPIKYKWRIVCFKYFWVQVWLSMLNIILSHGTCVGIMCEMLNYSNVVYYALSKLPWHLLLWRYYLLQTELVMRETQH